MNSALIVLLKSTTLFTCPYNVNAEGDCITVGVGVEIKLLSPVDQPDELLETPLVTGVVVVTGVLTGVGALLTTGILLTLATAELAVLTGFTGLTVLTGVLVKLLELSEPISALLLPTVKFVGLSGVTVM
jgi:hypothetical protein